MSTDNEMFKLILKDVDLIERAGCPPCKEDL